MDFLYYDILICIIFTIFVVLFLFRNKKNVKREGVFFLYKSKLGIRLMEKLVRKYPRFFNFITKINIVIGFAGMAAIFILLILSNYNLAIMPKVIKTPPIVPLLPWISFPGMPTLYFTIWIIMISIIAIVHEGAHGIFACLNKVKVKGTGFGFLGPIALAFVEPDEKQIMKRSPKAQMSIFSAGPVANFATAIIFFAIIMLIINPVYISSVQGLTMKVGEIENNSPAHIAGIEKGDIIIIENMNKTISLEQYSKSLSEFILGLKPNQEVNITLENKNQNIIVVTKVSPQNVSRGYIGIKGFELLPQFEGIGKSLPMISALFYWIFMANIFVGLFNLMPFWVVDGGRMFYAAAFAITKSKKRAMSAMKKATSFSLFLIELIFVIWVFRMLFG